MRREIFLPELLSISIRNFTLYPNGLDYSFDFVKGVNLVLGGNGMGKTTFVNIIRFAITGLYKKPFGYSRTYQGNAIEKRQLFPMNYFSNRMDTSIQTSGNAVVSLKMRLNDTIVELSRDLTSITLLTLSVDGKQIEGDVINQFQYEKLTPENKESTLPYQYEQIIHKYTNLSFDDLIFFVNDVLFFGEDHKTILWKGGESMFDVQVELFNKYFNDPELDKRRQEASRKAKYYDSLSRHNSEDMRAINKVLSKINSSVSVDGSFDEEDVTRRIIECKSAILKLDQELEAIQDQRSSKNYDLSIAQNELNILILAANDLDRQISSLEAKLNHVVWGKLHPSYDLFVRNIRLNHICPMCGQTDEELVGLVAENENTCFVCGQSIDGNVDELVQAEYDTVRRKRNDIYNSVNTIKRRIHEIEEQVKELDTAFSNIGLTKRQTQQQLRELEYSNAMSDNSHNSIQPFLDEIERLTNEKINNQHKSEEFLKKANDISKQIEDEITNNVHAFSDIFSTYAGMFLGVPCYLTYMKQQGSEIKRFYPVIDGKIRFDEEEMSESQRFFIDHSFRMSILTFFYNTPAFYIVETPDSSLDISYESNAANVFMRFLEKPNSLIITSNLNNSSFVEYLLDQEHTNFAMVGLLEIAKQSVIQNTSIQLLEIYKSIKEKVKYVRA